MISRFLLLPSFLSFNVKFLVLVIPTTESEGSCQEVPDFSTEQAVKAPSLPKLRGKVKISNFKLPTTIFRALEVRLLGELDTTRQVSKKRMVEYYMRSPVAFQNLFKSVLLDDQSDLRFKTRDNREMVVDIAEDTPCFISHDQKLGFRLEVFVTTLE